MTLSPPTSTRRDDGPPQLVLASALINTAMTSGQQHIQRRLVPNAGKSKRGLHSFVGGIAVEGDEVEHGAHSAADSVAVDGFDFCTVEVGGDVC